MDRTALTGVVRYFEKRSGAGPVRDPEQSGIFFLFELNSILDRSGAGISAAVRYFAGPGLYCAPDRSMAVRSTSLNLSQCLQLCGE